MTGSRVPWSAHALESLSVQRRAAARDYLEFLRVPALNAGLYELAAGSDDPQEPHDEDEIYYVIAGKARFSVDGEDVPVAPGAILYVAAGVEHRFHSIREDLSLLVVFSGS